MELNEAQVQRAVATVRLLVANENWMSASTTPSTTVTSAGTPAAAITSATEAAPLEAEEPSPREIAALALEMWMEDVEVQRRLGVNRYEGSLWFNKEAFEEWLWWMYAVAVAQEAAREDMGTPLGKRIANCFAVIHELKMAEEASGYRVEGLVKALATDQG